MRTYTGGCHCGAIRYAVDADLSSGLECNCTHCAKKGFLLAFVPAAQFRLTEGSDAMTTEYRFNKKTIAHLFCPTCGVQCFGRGKGPDGSDAVAVNLRTLDDGIPEGITVQHYNGRDI